MSNFVHPTKSATRIEKIGIPCPDCGGKTRNIKQMQIWMEGDRHESKITPFASEAMRFTERADDNEAKIARIEEKLPALNTRIDELSKHLNQIELECLNLSCVSRSPHLIFDNLVDVCIEPSGISHPAARGNQC